MKNLISTLLFGFFFLLVVTGVQAQDKPIKKVNPKISNSKQLNKTKLNKNSTINKNLKLNDNQIPEFRITRPQTISPSASDKVNTKQLRKANLIPSTTFNYRTSPVNATLTPRNPHHSGRAYVEFLSGSVRAGTNKVECDCGKSTDASYVTLFLRAEAGKRYMLTVDVSLYYQKHFKLELISSGYVHEASIDSDNQKVDIILSAENSGSIVLTMQCSDEKTNGKGWVFNSARIQEIE